MLINHSISIKKLSLIILLVVCYSIQAQDYIVTFDISDIDKVKISDVEIISNEKILGISDQEGRTSIVLAKGSYTLLINHFMYQPQEISINLSKNTVFNIELKSDYNQLQKVVITAKEDKGLTSKSIITKEAMQHLQPSSFTDLMELLPGGLARDPSLTSNNSASLRESRRPSDYNTTSLGIQFMIDDNVINSGANLQTSLDADHLLKAAENRYTTSTGVDMRTLSTNDIEKVEIIRGIPSAGYGDLTSGLIKIDRKIRHTPIQVRFKSDGFSKQYYTGKGFRIKDSWDLFASLDLLDAKSTPDIDFNNYQRLTSSLRSKAKFKIGENSLEWRSNLDYSNNLDKQKADPDTGYDLVDKYKSSNQNIALSNNFIYNLKDENLFFNKFILNTSARQGFEKLEQTKFVQLSGPRAVSIATEQGENVGYFPETRYISDFETDGKPLNISAMFQANGRKTIGAFNHKYEAGLDFRLAKNYGTGHKYDILRPVTGGMTTRPRRFDDIPAYQLVATFLGDEIAYKINNHRFTLYAGLRFSSMLNVGSDYKINNKIYTEPRVNLQYNLPKLILNNSPFLIDLTMGYGEFYKMPTLNNLYPNDRFWDYTQLSFFHKDADYRYAYFMTYKQNTVNKNLVAAKNIKKELRVDLSYKNHNLFVNFYKENLENGFRAVSNYTVHSYKRYDNTQVDLSTWNNGPDLTNIPFESRKVWASYTTTENGSETTKNGVEFGYSSPRIKTINTRFTFTGSYFRTQYRNTIPVQEKPQVSLVGNDYQYVGIYKNDMGYDFRNMNYNLFIDTYIPNLNLTFSASFQGSLFNREKRDKRIAKPDYYVDPNGNIFPYTEIEQSDAILQ